MIVKWHGLCWMNFRLPITLFNSSGALCRTFGFYHRHIAIKLTWMGQPFSQNQQAGAGVVVKELEDRVTAAMSKRIHQPLGPLEIEAKAMEEGISFAWDTGLHEVILIQKL